MTKEKSVLTYSDYMTYHVGGSGILGLAGSVINFFHNDICQTLGIITMVMALAIYFWGKLRKREKRDEFATEIIHRSGAAGLLSITLVSLILLLVYGGTYIAKYSIMVNPFEFITNTAMVFLWLFLSVLGISFRYLESRC